MRLVSILAAAFLLGAGALAFSTTLDEEGTVDQIEVATSDEECGLGESTNDIVEGDDGVDIHITVHEPSLDEGEDAPVILHSHGWAGARAQTPNTLIGDLLDACYGVVSIDMRGHGESGGQANVHHPDHEIKDVINVLDHIEELDWVHTSDGDIVAGAIGGSYGGGFQLLTAALDPKDRIDAIAPDMTWNDLPYALAPNDAIKSVWVDLLYGAGTAQAELAPFIHEAYWTGAATNEVPQEAMDSFNQSSPTTHANDIDVPILLRQGIPDTLFNLNQALWNADQVATAPEDVYLLTHLGGHILNTDGTIPNEAPFDGGIQPGADSGACTDQNEAVVAWYDYHLKDVGTALADAELAPVEIALDDASTCLDGFDDIQELYGDDKQDGFETVVVTQGAPLASGYVQAGPLEATPESPVSLDLFTAQEGEALAGVPILSGTASANGAGAIAYLSLIVSGEDGERIASSQVTPLRLDALEEETFELELGGVGAALDADDEVRLQISSWDPQYAHNQERAPGALVLEDLEIALPLVEGS